MAVPVGGGYLSSLVAVPLLWIGAVVSLIVGSVAPVQLVGDSISVNTWGEWAQRNAGRLQGVRLVYGLDYS